MKMLMAGAAAGLVLLACTTTSGAGESPGIPGPVVLQASSLEGVDPASLPELERVEGLMHEGSFVGARALLDRVLARRPSGRTLEVARKLEQALDLDPAFLPALQALERAVESGADREARRIVDRLRLRRPRGRVLSLLEAYRRILDGRALVAGLRLALELRPTTSREPAPADARFSQLVLVAESRLDRAVELEPGPATLVVTRSTVDRRALGQDAVETRTFTNLGTLRIERGRPVEIPLARFFIAPPESGLATRLRFSIELRSGVVRLAPAEAGGKTRELPAMRLRAEEAEDDALAGYLAAQPESKPEDLARLVENATKLDAVAALAVALRIPPGERGRALDLLAPRVETVPLPVVESLAPALRWIALTSEPGSNGVAWRMWLRAREERKIEERPRLVLPPARSAE